MRSRNSNVETGGYLRTVLVLCCLLLLSLPNAALSTPSGQTSAAPNQLSQPAAPPQSGPSATPGSAPPQQALLSTATPQVLSGSEEVKEALLKEAFSYNPNEMVDPFISFITPVELAPATPQLTTEEPEPPPEPQKPLTPLQKMSVAEIERGLRAISWGELGRRAVIEDAAGKGYIVSVGTPAGDRNGIITEIFNDRLVVQQEVWDRKQKRTLPQNSVVKLRKEKEQ